MGEIPANIERAAAILEKVEPSNPFTYGKWRSIVRSDLRKIAVVRALSPQTRVSSLRSLEYSADLDELLTNIPDERIEEILRKHYIRFPKRKVKAVKLVRSIDWASVIKGLEKFSGRSLDEEREARMKILERTFGMGLKTVSDFLKDIGFSRYLAVLDGRNLKFLKSVGLAPQDLKAARLSNRKIYHELEDVENKMASQLRITVSELDERIMTYTESPGEMPHKL